MRLARETKIFGPSELALVAGALEVAEEAVSDHYRLSETEWLRYPYELRTWADLVPVEQAAGQALAQVMRLRQPASPKRMRARDFYRICLQDPNLMGVIKREGAGELMQPLLTYVLAHELVHVVRFGSFQHLFQAGPDERSREEAKVHAITAQSLAKVRLPHMERVLNLYEKHGGECWAAGEC